MATKNLTSTAYNGKADGTWRDQPHTAFVRKNGRAFWRYRVNANGISINTTRAPGASLAEDRRKWADWNALVAQGINPLNRAQTGTTFASVAQRYLDKKLQELSSKPSKNAYKHTLGIACDAWGDWPIEKVRRDDVLALLKREWRPGGKVETYSRLRQRLEGVFSLAIADGLIDGPNPAAWKDNLEHYLPIAPKIMKSDRIAAMPYSEAPAFYQRIREGNSISHKALEFYMLTIGARIGGTRHLAWEQVDFEQARWICPGEFHKSRKDWPTPLLPRCLEILEEARELAGRESPWAFVSPYASKDGPVSNTAISKVHDAAAPDDASAGRQADVHGWRSTFKTWAEEQSSAPSRVIEVQSGRLFTANAAEAAYMRGDLREKRMALLWDWWGFLNN